MCTMSLMPLSRAARFASRGISMPMISSAGDTMRALIPWINPLYWSATLRVSSRLTLLSAMMSGIVASPVWQMCRNGITSVWQFGMMCLGKPLKVAAPALPASTIVVTPAYTPPRSGWTPVRLKPSKTCACRSIRPGATILPATSIVRVASALGMSAAMREISPPHTATSMTPSSPVEGSTTVPPLSKRSCIGSFLQNSTSGVAVRGEDGLRHLVGRRSAALVGREGLAVVVDATHGRLEALGFGAQTHVVEHHGRRADGRRGIRDAAAGDVGRRAVHGLEIGPAVAEAARRRQPEPTRCLGAEVGQDVGVLVHAQHDVHAPGEAHEPARGVVDVE